MVNFLPLKRMYGRIESAKDDSDIAYFYDLLLLGEQITKIVALFLVSAMNDDKERTRYRHEHFLVRANAVGDFSKTIDDVLTGPSAELITSNIRDNEFKELTHRVPEGSWQYDSMKILVECLDIFNINHEGLSSKAPLKQWFHLFTVLRNKTKGHGAATCQACKSVCPKIDNSINLIINNLTLFDRPCAYLYRNLSGKYRVSFLSEKTIDFDFLKRNTNQDYENGVYFYLDKPRKLNLFYSNPELTDFYYPNGNIKNDTFETISYVSDERIIQSAKEYINPVTSLPGSHTEGLDQLETIGNVFTNLPKPTDEYISRISLEDELKKILLDEERFPVITLVGRGGIGKTSLAINVIRNIFQLSRFDLVIWFSARDIDLLIEGPKQVQTKVLNQKDIATDYCNLIYPGELIKDKVQLFSSELTKNKNGKTLYIFDNFETLTNPVEIFEWINTYIRNPNKVLITSRMSRNFKADYPIEVRGMSELECKELINIISNKFEIKDLLTLSFIDELINESDGHPYIIKILLGEVAKSKKIGKVQRIVAENDKVLSALFKRTFNTLSPAAKRVFLTLCSWNSAIPIIAIEAVLWRPENEKIDVQGAIDELQKSSFIELVNDDKDTFVNVPLAALLFGKKELEVYAEKLKILEDRKLLMEFGATTQNGITDGVASRVKRKFSEVAKRMSSINDFKTELPILEYIAGKFSVAWIYLSQIYEEYNDFVGVKYCLREFLKSDDLSIDQKAIYWLKLADVCRSTEDWSGESHSLSELVLLPGITYEQISDCANRINNYIYYHLEARQVDYKSILLEKVIGVMISRISEANATDYSRLAWLFLNDNKTDKAKEYVDKGLLMDEDNPHCLKLFMKINE